MIFMLALPGAMHNLQLCFTDESAMPITAADSLLADLSTAVGMPLSFDQDGQCAMLFAPDIEVVVAQAGESGHASIRSPLLAMTDLTPAKVLRDALACNYGALPPGHAVACDPGSAHLVLISMIDLATAVPEDFLTRVATFIALVPALRSRLSSDALAPDDQALTPLIEPKAFDLVCMLRV